MKIGIYNKVNSGGDKMDTNKEGIKNSCCRSR